MTKQLSLINAEQLRDSSFGRLDEETKRVGREGLSMARAALQQASGRAAARDAARLARRDDEIARRAAMTRGDRPLRGDDSPKRRPAAA